MRLNVRPYVHLEYTIKTSEHGPVIQRYLEPGKVVLIPRNTVHGLRLKRTRGARAAYLIAVNTPPIADDDTIYI